MTLIPHYLITGYFANLAIKDNSNIVFFQEASSVIFIDSSYIVNAGHLIQVSCIASVPITKNLLLQLTVLWVKYHLNRKIHMTFHVISII